MTTTAELVSGFETILVRLHDATGASRMTLRLDDAERGFSVADVVAESADAGLPSLRGQTSINQRAAATAQWLERERRALVQDDFSAAPQPPDALKALYGVQAQMLGPIEADGALVGWISVHECRGPRQWRDEDIAALEQAMAAVCGLLTE